MAGEIFNAAILFLKLDSSRFELGISLSQDSRARRRITVVWGVGEQIDSPSHVNFC